MAHTTVLKLFDGSIEEIVGREILEVLRQTDMRRAVTIIFCKDEVVVVSLFACIIIHTHAYITHDSCACVVGERIYEGAVHIGADSIILDFNAIVVHVS